MKSKGVGYIFMFLFFLIFITQGWASEANKKEVKKIQNINYKYVAYGYGKKYISISPKMGSKDFSKILLDQLYEELLIEAYIRTALDSGFIDELCKNISYKAKCDHYLTTINGDFDQEVNNTLSEMEEIEERAEAFQDSMEYKEYRSYINGESKHLLKKPPFNQISFVSDYCNKHVEFTCALKLKAVLQDRILSTISGLQDSLSYSILERYKNNYDFVEILKKNILNPTQLKLLMNEQKKNNIQDDIKDTIQNIKDLLNDHNLATK